MTFESANSVMTVLKIFCLKPVSTKKERVVPILVYELFIGESYNYYPIHIITTPPPSSHASRQVECRSWTFAA